MRREQTRDLTTGSITGQLLRFAVPLIVSGVVQQLYNAADTAVVGRFAGTIALAAVGSTGHAINLTLNMTTGLSVGTNVLCARYRGAGDREGLRRCMHVSLLLAFLAGFAVAALGAVLAKPILQLMGLSETILGPAVTYMQIYLLGSPASLVYNFGAGILRSHGDTQRPMTIGLISGLVNVALNLFFVLVLHMDAAGVAIATVISQIVGAAAVVYILFSPRDVYRMTLRELRLERREAGRICAIGIPCGFNGAVFTVSNLIIQSALFTFPDVVVAGSAAATKVTNVTYYVINAFATTCVTFSGQCAGKGDYRRIDRLLVRACALGMGLQSLCMVFLSLFPTQALSVFTKEAEVAAAGAPQMLVVGWAYLLLCICDCVSASLRGLGKSVGPTLINACCICLPRTLWVYLVFPHLRTLGALYLCYPVSFVIAGTVQISYYVHCRRKADAQSGKEPTPCARN